MCATADPRLACSWKWRAPLPCEVPAHTIDDGSGVTHDAAGKVSLLPGPLLRTTHVSRPTMDSLHVPSEPPVCLVTRCG